ncbi:MAG: hypothetical protein ABIG85_05960 [Chloroflexota bacterium]
MAENLPAHAGRQPLVTGAAEPRRARQAAPRIVFVHVAVTIVVPAVAGLRFRRRRRAAAPSTFAAYFLATTQAVLVLRNADAREKVLVEVTIAVVVRSVARLGRSFVHGGRRLVAIDDEAANANPGAVAVRVEAAHLALGEAGPRVVDAIRVLDVGAGQPLGA